MSCSMTSYFKSLWIFAALLLLAGCSTLSPYSKLTKLDLTLNASDQLNPDLHGRPSPIVVRLIELKNPVAFENADFFSLYERAKESLAPDMVASEELELRPGESSISSSASTAAAVTSAFSPPTATYQKPNGVTWFSSPPTNAPTPSCAWIKPASTTPPPFWARQETDHERS